MLIGPESITLVQQTFVIAVQTISVTERVINFYGLQFFLHTALCLYLSVWTS